MEEIIYQSMYFKYMKDIHPGLNYNNIVLELIDRFKVNKIKFQKNNLWILNLKKWKNKQRIKYRTKIIQYNTSSKISYNILW